MKNILKKHDISLRLLSLLLSVVLWAVVMDMDNPERPRTFDNIPVRISGAAVLQQQTGLSLIEGADSTVKITLRGPSKTLGDIKASQIAASVDISGLTEANEYDLPVSVTVSRSGLEVEYISPSKVHVRVDKVDTKDIPVDVNVTGTPADGCRAGKPTSPVSTITVQGPAAELTNVAKAVAVIDVTGAESTLTNIECPVTLYDRDGTVVASQHITSKTEKIKVTVPMYNIDTLPLTVTLKDGGKLTAHQVKYSINPESVKVVTSDQASLGDLKELNLGEIDLGSVRTGVPIYEISTGTGAVSETDSLGGYTGGGADAAYGSGYTSTSGMKYSDGSIGKLSIPSIGVNKKVYDGETIANMRLGAAHFEGTSGWDGNVAMCGHNRGSYGYFGNIHTLKNGDTISYTTIFGTRTYKVYSVRKIAKTDTSVLDPSDANIITLITCVRDVPSQRWCVQAMAI